MCIRNRQIINPTSHFVYGKDKRFVMIPCGECQECIKSLKNEWYIRSYAEYKTYKNEGGRIMFVTLTYDYAHLPKFPDFGFSVYDKDGNPQKCFNYYDIKNFIQSLKVYLQRSSQNKSCEGLHFLVCAEYGHDYVYLDRNGVEHQGKAMPHYHVLLFIPRHLSNINNRKLKTLVEKAWHRGFVLYSKMEKGGAFVNNEKALRYVSKYCAKDFGFYGLENVNTFYNALKFELKSETDSAEIEYKKERLKEFRRLLPRHYQSTNFGYDYLKYCFVRPAEGCTKDCPKYEISDSAAEYIKHGIKPDLCDFYYKIPRYVINRLCYQYKSKGEGGFRYLTPLGKDIMKLVATVNVAEQANSYYGLVNTLGIQSFCSDDVFEKKFKMTPSDFCSMFWNKMGNRNLTDLVVYDIVYKDVVRDDVQNFDYFNKFTTEEYTVNAMEFYIFRLERSNDKVTLYPLTLLKKRLTPNIPAYEYNLNDLDAFRDFDVLLGYLQALSSFREKQLRAFEIEEKRKNTIRNKYDNYGFHTQTQTLC